MKVKKAKMMPVGKKIITPNVQTFFATFFDIGLEVSLAFAGTLCSHTSSIVRSTKMIRTSNTRRESGDEN
jgi:hypothetical protein